MIQVGATLDRAVQLAPTPAALLFAVGSADLARPDDDDLLDALLAALSADEFERLLNGLLHLR